MNMLLPHFPVFPSRASKLAVYFFKSGLHSTMVGWIWKPSMPHIWVTEIPAQGHLVKKTSLLRFSNSRFFLMKYYSLYLHLIHTICNLLICSLLPKQDQTWSFMKGLGDREEMEKKVEGSSPSDICYDYLLLLTSHGMDTATGSSIKP